MKQLFDGARGNPSRSESSDQSEDIEISTYISHIIFVVAGMPRFVPSLSSTGGCEKSTGINYINTEEKKEG